jgi:hypothetical protein
MAKSRVNPQRSRRSPDRVQFEPVVFIQVDLEGHSLWFQRAPSKPQAVAAKIDLVRRLNRCVHPFGFQLLYWAGDGGMYRHEPKPDGNLDKAVDGAYALAKAFDAWRARKQPNQLDLSALRLRISIHSANSVYTHKNPGYWTSEDLNAFAKYERQIAIAGTVAITDTVRPHLSASRQARFPAGTKREILIGNSAGTTALIRSAYYSVLKGGDAALDQPSLPLWLNQVATKMKLPVATDIGPVSVPTAVIGDAVVLQSIQASSEVLIVDLKQQSAPIQYSLDPSEEAKLEAAAKALREESIAWNLEDKEKISSLRVVFPLVDVPCMRIEWHPERWSKARAFHSALQQDKALRDRLKTTAADVQFRGLPFPGILCAHIVARIAPNPGGDTPLVLICQRNLRGPKDTYHEGKWSCSIEEQMHPGESIEQCIRRGVSEELLGPAAAAHVAIRVLAAFLEAPILNLSILASVDIPLTYAEVVNKWRHEANDRNEHRQISALPLRRDLVISLGKNQSLSKDLHRYCMVFDRQIFSDTQEWRLHPTSPIRLAAALWERTQ